MPLRPGMTPEKLNHRIGDNLPGWFSMKVVEVAEGLVAMEYVIRPQYLAPNGYLHAASVIALADTAAGYATIAHLPDGATSFTTIELKSNFIGTATEGSLRAEARAAHQGRTDAGLGRGRHARGKRQDDRALPVHPDDSLAEAQVIHVAARAVLGTAAVCAGGPAAPHARSSCPSRPGARAACRGGARSRFGC